MLDATQIGAAAMALAVAVPLAAAVVYDVVYLRKTRAPYLRPSSTLPLLGNTLDFAERADDMHDWFADMAESFQGRTFLLTCVGKPDMLLASSPAVFEDVFKTQFEVFEKGALTLAQMRDFFGEGIFSVDGIKWIQQRKTASHLFTMRALRDSMTEIVRSKAQVLTAMFEQAAATGEAIDIARLSSRFIMETFGKNAFGIDMACLTPKEDHPFQHAFDRAQRAIVARFFCPTWWWKLKRFLNVGSERELKHDVKLIDAFVYSIIDELLSKRDQIDQQPTVAPNVVSLFLNSPMGQDKNFDFKMLRDVVLTFVLAGRDSMAQGISWFFRALTMHPEVERQVREEIQRELPELLEKGAAFPDMDQVQRLTYLEAALKETLRLWPPLPMNMRRAVHDTVLSDGTNVRAGTIVIVPTYVLGRMTTVWGPDAKEFKPERWIDPTTGKLVPVSPFKFMAFHAGPRSCLGKNMAMTEMKILIAGLVSKFHLEVLSPEKVTYEHSTTLPIRGPLNTRVHMAAGAS